MTKNPDTPNPSSPLEAYGQYLKVLGIDRVLLPELPTEVVPMKPTSQPGYRVLFVDDRPWAAPAKALFERMRQAMKLSADEVRVEFRSQMNLADFQVLVLTAPVVVCFSPNIFQDIEMVESEKFLTHGPQELIQNSQLKKKTWEDLQQVMRSLA